MLLENEDLTTQETISESEGQSASDRVPWLMPKEQLLQWKRNRRALVVSLDFYFFSPSFLSVYLINLFFLALTEDYRNCWGCPFL